MWDLSLQQCLEKKIGRMIVSWCHGWTRGNSNIFFTFLPSAYQCETKRFKTNKKRLGFKVTSVQAVLKTATLLDLFPHKISPNFCLQSKSIVDSFITNLLSASQQTAWFEASFMFVAQTVRDKLWVLIHRVKGLFKSITLRMNNNILPLAK